MVKLMIDTCVWLDIAKDPNLQGLLSVLDELIREKKVCLVVPEITIEEFNRNKVRIVEENKKSIAGVIRRVKDVVKVFGDPNSKDDIITHLEDVSHKVPTMGEYAASGSVNWIDTLLKTGELLPITDDIILKAAKRGILSKAPFHKKNKNSIADAIIIETYIDAISAKKRKSHRFLFVTHNTSDFSHPTGNVKLPHPDFVEYFVDDLKSAYHINMAEALRSIFPRIVPRMLSEFEAFNDPPRSVSTILQEESRLVDMIWYNRHKIREEKIESGEIIIIENAAQPNFNHNNTILREIWENAKLSAARVEVKYNLSEDWPWDDFEWGMLNGKLSALRWFLGQEWDELYT